jgi:hypothetical protein
MSVPGISSSAISNSGSAAAWNMLALAPGSQVPAANTSIGISVLGATNPLTLLFAELLQAVAGKLPQASMAPTKKASARRHQNALRVKSSFQHSANSRYLNPVFPFH